MPPHKMNGLGQSSFLSESGRRVLAGEVAIGWIRIESNI